MSELIQPVAVLIVCILGWRLVTWRSEYGLAGDVTSRHQRCLEHTAEQECDLGMCQHMVGDRHPQLVVSQNGKRYWKLDSTFWEEGTSCPLNSDSV